MNRRDIRVRIGEISVSSGRFDEHAFRRLVRERLATRNVENRHAVRTTVGDAARKAVKDGSR